MAFATAQAPSDGYLARVHAPVDPQYFPGAGALYAPPALRRFALTQVIAQPSDIAIERFRRRLNIHKADDDPPPHQVHPHFLTKTTDRHLATHEAIQDIRDAVTAMDNVADVLFIGFVVRPEWNPSEHLDPEKIDIEQITSHHVKQHPVYQEVVDDLRKIIQTQVALPHVYSYHQRLHSVTPGCGYAIDEATGRLRANGVQLAPGISIPTSVVRSSGTVSTGVRSDAQTLRVRLTTTQSVTPTVEAADHPRPTERSVPDPSTVSSMSTEGLIPVSLVEQQALVSSNEPVCINTARGPRWVRRGPQRECQQPSSVSPPLIPSSGASNVSSNATAAPTTTRRTHRGGRSHIAGAIHGNLRSSSRGAASQPSVSSNQTVSLVRLVGRGGTTIGMVPLAITTTSTPASHPPASDPIVISDSDSDEPASPSESLTSTSIISISDSDVESWVHTPDGSPCRLSSRHTVPTPAPDVLPLPDYPPPEYSPYLEPTLDSFGFHPEVAGFLESRNLPPSGLVRIDSTLNYQLGDWIVGFREAGLSDGDTRELREVVIQSLSDDLRHVLITACTAERD